MKSLIKKILSGVAISPILATVFIPTSCSTKTVSMNEVIDKLLSIKKIKRLDIITDCPSFLYKFVLYFEQPVSWTDSSKGTFLQRIEFGFNGYDNINTMLIDGYDIFESNFNKKCKHELVEMYNSNYLNIEYRYFGKSIPSFYDTENVNTWDELTFVNAIKDFHAINQSLRTVLKGKWVITGGSKGGQNTNLYSMYYPEDANCFLSLVAPRCYTFSDEDKDRLINFVTNEIGDNSDLGPVKAAEMRLEYLNFQHYLLTDAVVQEIAPIYYENSVKTMPFTQYVYDHPYSLYYTDVIDLSTGLWQYNNNPTEVDPTIVAINKLADSDPNKLPMAKEYFFSQFPVSNNGLKNDIYSYYVQGWKQMGYYNTNPDILNTKFKELGLPDINWNVDNKGIDSSDFDNLLYKIVFTEEFLSKVTHDEQISKDLANWTKTTTSNVIMIYGSTDPWYTYALDKTDNPNIHVFVDKINPHTACVKTLDPVQKAAAISLLDQWLK